MLLEGYLTMWDVGKYLEDPSSENRVSFHEFVLISCLNNLYVYLFHFCVKSCWTRLSRRRHVFVVFIAQDLIKQVICWRGHLTKVTMLEYIDATKAIISGSTDSSVRFVCYMHMTSFLNLSSCCNRYPNFLYMYMYNYVFQFATFDAEVFWRQCFCFMVLFHLWRLVNWPALKWRYNRCTPVSAWMFLLQSMVG